MDRVFYEVAAGSPAHDFCEDYAAKRNAVKQAYADFADLYGARGWTEGFTKLHGLIFDYGAQIPEGFKKERRSTSDGKDVYTPRARTPAGKAIIAQRNALPSLPSQSEFATHFGIPTSLKYAGGECITGSERLMIGFSIECVFIAWAKPGEYWVILPDIDSRITERLTRYVTVEPSSWVLPDGLRKSTEARYDLAVAQAKVEEETSS